MIGGIAVDPLDLDAGPRGKERAGELCLRCGKDAAVTRNPQGERLRMSQARNANTNEADYRDDKASHLIASSGLRLLGCAATMA
jgi:hypothetical protein